MNPGVSIILPVRDGARWLGEAVESLLSQTYRDFEIVAVDDGSADASPRILDAFSARDSRVRIVRQEGLGLVAALNRGLAEARGDFVARLDCDDIAMPERLERQLRVLMDGPEIGLLGTWAREIDENGRVCGGRAPETDSAKLLQILEWANPLIHSSVMARTEVLRRVGGYRAAFQAAEDYDLWLRVAEVARISILPEFLVQYRWHGQNASTLHTLRQAFSLRLAQLSAQARRESGRDPADGLVTPPDWHSPIAETSFYADLAASYRLFDRTGEGADVSLLVERFQDFNHQERAFATAAIADHVRRSPMRHWRLIFGLLRQRPSAALRVLRHLIANRA